MSRAKILVIDDEQEMLEMLQHLIKNKMQSDCILCASGKEAIESARKEKLDLIILDIQMPGMDGYEVCNILKQIENTKKIPVLFLTARTDMASKIKAFEYGAVDYISKPFFPEEAIARIFVHLRLKKSQEENLRYMEELYQLRYLDAMGSMVQGFSHNFNNLLTILCNQIELLKKISLQDNQQKIFMNLGQTIERMTDLLQRLQFFAASPVKNCEPIDFTNSLEKIMENFSLHFPQNIKMESFLGHESIKVQMPFVLLQHIVFSLLANSVEAIDSSPGVIKITFSNVYEKFSDTSEGKEWICLCIQDNGKGISQENQKHLFEPFFTTKNTVCAGLGLCVTYAIMKKYNGNIKIESIENQGTKARLYFPGVKC